MHIAGLAAVLFGPAPQQSTMFIYSIKFTFRSFLRDLVRGLPARLFLYPRLRMNERSVKHLTSYLKRVNVAISENPTALTVIQDDGSCIDKDAVRQDPNRFIVPRSIGTLLRNTISTSGSSGRPLSLIQDYRAIVKEEAFVYRQLTWTGYRHRDRRVWLRGDIVCSNNPKNQVFGCHDWWSNTLLLSSYHISSAALVGYVNAISGFDPVLIQAYPSSIYAIAKWMVASNVRYGGKSLLAVVTSSETLEHEMRTLIETAFGCPVFDWYGQAERVVAIGTCEKGKRHVLTDYSTTELLPQEGKTFELVGTGYNNRAMPLRRYRTGDLVTVGAGGCSCNRIFPVVKDVIGRREKAISLSDGRVIGRLDHVFKGAENVMEGQVVYFGDDRFVLRVVPRLYWKAQDSEFIKKQLTDRVDIARVAVEIVTSIPRGANGKFEFVRIEEAVV